MRIIARIAQWGIVAIGVGGLALVVFMAFAQRDHKVELIVTYPKSPPAAVWRCHCVNDFIRRAASCGLAASSATQRSARKR